MSILGTIISKILHGSQAAAAPASTSGAGGAAPAPKSTGSTTMSDVDVAKVLDEMAQKSREKLDWRHSIVDLMKLLGLDSSHAERIKLAQELNYTGNTNDSAAMNIWLHAEVMKKLQENGGKVPADLAKH